MLDSSRPARWLRIERKTSSAAESAMYQFGVMLHSCAFLSRFEVKRSERAPLFELQPDPRVRAFFTGEWLERWVGQTVRRVVSEQVGSWDDDQVLVGARVRLPDGTEGELDVLVGLPASRAVWLECKTGRWQDYVGRLRELNRRFLRLSLDGAALVLTAKLRPEERASASELTSVSVIHMSDLKGWLARAVRACAT